MRRTMGLDAVELVMEVEETFDVRIPDDAASEIRTPGQLLELVAELRRGRYPPASQCLTARLFRHLTATGQELQLLPQQRLRPRAPLQPWLPPKVARTQWRQWEQAAAMHFPSLERPAMLVAATTALTLIGGALVGWQVAARFGGAAGLFAGFFSLGVISGALYLLTQRWQTSVPASAATLGELTREVAARNYEAICRRWGEGSTDAMWPALQRLIATQLDVPLQKVTRDADFVRELGMD
jgi:acyl carrier protein